MAKMVWACMIMLFEDEQNPNESFSIRIAHIAVQCLYRTFLMLPNTIHTSLFVFYTYWRFTEAVLKRMREGTSPYCGEMSEL